MTSNVISNFLVGVGFDYDKESADQVGSGIDSIKSKALQLGTVVAGAFGLKTLTMGFSDNVNTMVRFADIYSVSAESVRALGNALEESGGSVEGAMSTLSGLEKLRAGLLKGDAGFIAAMGISQGDANDIINAKDALQAYALVAEQLQKATPKQRINIAGAAGLSEADITLMSKGRSEVERLLTKYEKIRPLTEQMSKDADEFNKQWIEMKTNIGSIADAISTELIPVINNVTKGINEWFGDDRVSRVKSIVALTKAAFGGGDAKETAESTGLPEWIFTTSIADTLRSLGVTDAYNNINDSPQPAFKPAWGGVNLEQSTPVYNGYQPVPVVPVVGFNQPQSRPSSQQMTPINVNATFNLDGQVIDRKIIKVVDGMAQTAIDDISSSNGG